MYFPWVGLLEQIKLADIFVHYDDVQLTRGFYNRVQVKTSTGPRWLTVPTSGKKSGQLINEVLIDNEQNWRENHREILRQSYIEAPFLAEMIAIVDDVFSANICNIGDLSKASTLALTKYFSLDSKTKFINSTDLDIPGSSYQRLHDIVIELNGDVYITGHGAKNYLNYELFENSDISVKYMNYGCLPYPQLHGHFTPYVSCLDLIANCGREGIHYINGSLVPWRDFLSERKK